MEIKKVIDKIRFRMNDTDAADHSDYEVLLAINDGCRMYHDICVKDNPDLIAQHFRNRTVGCENLACVPYSFTKITEVRCNGRLLHPAKMNEIVDTEAQGTPNRYVPKLHNGKLCLLMFPRPQESVVYSVDFIVGVEELDLEDDLMVSNDIANCIIDYSVAALTGADTSVAGVKLQELVNNLTPSPCVVESYY